MTDQGRIVVVAAGFALWTGGRCVAAARFSDIRRLRAVRPASADPDALALRVELTDGSVMELRDEAPGFDLFLDRAATSLKGLLPFSAWSTALRADDAPADGMLLFEKPRGW
jgi:hypothetical protein